MNRHTKAPQIYSRAGLFLILRNIIKYNCHFTAHGSYASRSSYLISQVCPARGQEIVAQKSSLHHHLKKISHSLLYTSYVTIIFPSSILYLLSIFAFATVLFIPPINFTMYLFKESLVYLPLIRYMWQRALCMPPYATCSIPRCPFGYHSLVCSENHLFIVGIRPICDKEL